MLECGSKKEVSLEDMILGSGDKLDELSDERGRSEDDVLREVARSEGGDVASEVDSESSVYLVEAERGRDWDQQSSLIERKKEEGLTE